MTTIDVREKQLDVPQTATKAVWKKMGGPAEFVKYDPSAIELEEGQVLVHITHTGVCHSDLHIRNGELPVPNKLQTTGEPMVGGHEGAGVVVKLGLGASQWLQKGARVGIKWIGSACLNCEFCMVGYESNCISQQNSGFSVDGTFQQYAVAPAKYVTPIPDNLPLAVAAPILCAGVTIYRALKEANLQPGQWVVLPGAGGGLGHLGVQYAAAFGYRVIAIDTGAEKKELCFKLGAEAWIDFKTSTDIVADVKRITGGLGTHATVVAAANESAYTQALAYLRPRGTLVCVGLPQHTTIKADVFETTLMAKTIKGSIVGNRSDCIAALQMSANGKVKLIYKMRGLSELNQVFEELETGALAGRVVLDTDK